MPSYDAATQRWSDETTVRTTGGSVGTPLASVKDMLSSLGPAYAASFASAMNAVAPGWKDIMGRLEGGIRDLLGGKLPADVTSMIESTMAEKNLSGGRYGQVADSATARTLGLTSLDMVGKGMDEANKYLQIAKGLSPQVTDLSGLIGGAMQYQSEAERLALQKSELSYSMAANTQKQADSTALQKLQLLLTAQGQKDVLAQRNKEFDASLDWTKQVSAFNRQYESFVNKTNERLAQEEIARKKKEQQTVMDYSGYGYGSGYNYGSGAGYGGVAEERQWGERVSYPTTYA